jgi:galactokinase
MYRIVHSPSRNLPDTAEFVRTVNELGQDPRPEVRGLFDGNSDLVVARAPGRLDVMGGIADYSGSLVLQMPIQEAAFVALQLDPIRKMTLVTLTEDRSRQHFEEISLADFEHDGRPVDYDIARARFERDPSRHWVAYVAGVFIVLMRERHVRFSSGARLLIGSQVPEGKGVSSSAAIEVAAMQAVAAAYDIAMAPRETALLCQKVENLVAGAPCGVMDQMTAVCGEESRLLALSCQPAEVEGQIPVPEDLSIWGLDSGVRHSVGGSDYGAVRAGAYMGYRMIAEIAGIRVSQAASTGRFEIDDPEWRGYLANLTPSEFEQAYAGRLPDRIQGAEFLSRFHGTTDSVTRVDPDRSYAVRVPTAHPIYENHRVRQFAGLISERSDERRLELLGELMYESHASYSACGLGSTGTDLLVRLVREAGPHRGLYGARITGGGSGGTVAVLAGREASSAIRAIAEEYAEQTGYRPHIFSGSSPGAAEFGHLKIRHQTSDLRPARSSSKP